MVTAVGSSSGERRHNPFNKSAKGGRALSASQLPLFLIHPPAGYGVLTTVGRKTGKKRARCVRAIRRGDSVYIVAIKAAATKGWLQNALANPEVRLRLPGGTLSGRARKLRDPVEVDAAKHVYCESVHAFDYLAWINWRHGRPTQPKIKELLQSWFATGTPIVVDIAIPSHEPDHGSS